MEMQFPAVLTTPRVSLPSLGMEIVSMEIPIPDVVMPAAFTMSFPLFGKAEFATLMRSNLYNMEASMGAGKEETGRYSAKFDVKGISPIDVLSMSMEGTSLRKEISHKFCFHIYCCCCSIVLKELYYFLTLCSGRVSPTFCSFQDLE